MAMAKGTVYLVGAGPGNPGLMTLRAKELVEQADVLVHDYLVHPSFMGLLKPGCERVYVGKQAGRHAMAQAEIEALLVDRARAGKRAVRLKGGDPLIFGRGAEEARALVAAGVPFEIAPGVTAAAGAAAYSGTPLTERSANSTVVFVTGHENPEKPELTVDWASLPKRNATICIYMGVGGLARIASAMLEAGFDPDVPAVCVEWATLGHQRTCRSVLGKVAADAAAFSLKPPAIVFVGETAAMGETLSWFEKKPLQGRRLVVTRSQGQASELSRLLEERGADALGLPLIEIERGVDAQTAADVFAELGSYDWLVFSSPNGVRGFFEAFFETFEDIRSLGFLRIAAVGQATAKEIRKYYVSVDLIPEEANAESLAEALVATGTLDSAKALVATGNLGRETLTAKLEEARAIVDRFEVYRTRPTDLSSHPAAKRFREQGADAILFTSPSGAKSFVAQAEHLVLEKDALRPKTVSIGPITSEAMRGLGLPVDLQAAEASLESLVETVVSAFGKSENGE